MLALAVAACGGREGLDKKEITVEFVETIFEEAQSNRGLIGNKLEAVVEVYTLDQTKEYLTYREYFEISGGPLKQFYISAKIISDNKIALGLQGNVVKNDTPDNFTFALSINIDENS